MGTGWTCKCQVGSAMDGIWTDVPSASSGRANHCAIQNHLWEDYAPKGIQTFPTTKIKNSLWKINSKHFTFTSAHKETGKITNYADGTGCLDKTEPMGPIGAKKEHLPF